MQNHRPILRIAPTPSGYLHLGNIINFILTRTYARAHGGVLLLRIDDMDEARSKKEFIEDIFTQLDWLGFDFDAGPSSVGEQLQKHSFKYKKHSYKKQLQTLLDQNAAYACGCSRKQLRPYGNLYPGFCRDAGHQLRAGKSAARIRLPEEKIVLGGRELHPAKEYGDFVLWRKDDLPAYHFASLLFDAEAGVDTLIRGEDLLFSSAVQLQLAKVMGKQRFLQSRFYHHPLLRDPKGGKFSKSDRSTSIAQMRQSGYSKQEILTQAARFLGIEKQIETLEGFLGYAQKLQGFYT